MTLVPESTVADSQTGKQRVRKTDGKTDKQTVLLLPQLFTSTNTEAPSLVQTHTRTHRHFYWSWR